MPQKTARRAAPPIPPESFLTIPEAAARLRMSRRTVYTLVKKGHLPAHRFVGTDCVRIADRDLDAYVAQSRPAEN